MNLERTMVTRLRWIVALMFFGAASVLALGQTAPTITSLSPTVGPVSPVGGSLTIKGSGFGATQGSSGVTFGGLTATPSSWSATKIVIPVLSSLPAGFTDVVVSVNGISSSARSFLVIPVITRLSPLSGIVGTSVTVSGTSFGGQQGASTITFNGVTAIPTLWSNTSITTPVPSGANYGPVVVTVNGFATNGTPFLVSPSISAVQPLSALVGTQFTVTGEGFGPNQGSQGTLTVSGIPAVIASWNTNSISATVPPGATSGNLVVTTANLQSSNAVNFNIISANPVTVTPATAVVGSAISLTGASFGPAQADSTLSLGGLTLPVVNWNDGEIRAVIPAGAKSGTILLTVQGVSYEAQFNVIPVPANGIVTTLQYDPKGQLLSVTDPLNHATSFSYTSAGLPQNITDALGNVTQFQYDAAGNRTAAIDGLQNQTSYIYDAMNRPTKVTFADGSTNQFVFDIRGRRVSSTDGNGKTTSFAYDDADRLITVTDANGAVTQYAYDGENNLVAITDGLRRQTAFVYDDLGRVTQTVFPSGLIESYTYDANGNLLTKTDRNGNTIAYAYDVLNRMVTKSLPDATTVSYAFDLANRITQVIDPTGSYGFSYDNLGRWTGASAQYNSIPGKTFTTAYAYDNASNRVTLIDAQGATTRYAHDALNRITSIQDVNASTFGLSYDAIGRRIGLTRPNGVNTNYSYDAVSNLASVQHQKGAATLDGAVYAYDSAGNRTSKTNLLQGTTFGYTYDNVHQLTGVTQGQNPVETYSYDAVGNRLRSQTVSSYTYNVSNQLAAAGATTFTYDNNGNTLTKTNNAGVTRYNWDFENRLTSVTLPDGRVVSFRYDPFGRRIQKESASFLYDGTDLIEEVDSTGNPTARYSFTGSVDEPLVAYRGTSSAFFEADGLGSTTSLSGVAGAASDIFDYDSFGNLTASTATFSQPFRFAGREWDSETGLYFYRARYFDPSVGRFLSEDPSGFDGGGNFYAYAGNDPVNYVDPFGLQRRKEKKKPQKPPDPCPAEKRCFFDWLDAPLTQMAKDLSTTKTLMFTMAAKEGGWQQSALDHNMPLNNPFGVNNIKNGRAVGNKAYPDIAAAAHEWERLYADRVRGVQSPDDFVYGLQHPDKGQPYNTAHKDVYEDVFQEVYGAVTRFMRLCGIHE